MSDRAAFLAAIVAQPDDDLPRLIFADWLDEHDDPERAEFIRLQCAGGLSFSNQLRVASLEARNRTAWVGPLAQSVFRAEFRRGFVEHAVMSASAFLKYGDALRRATPLRGVTLLGARRVLPELVRGSHLTGLSALHLTGGRVGDDGVRLLANCSALSGLMTLRLGDSNLSDAGATTLARSANLANLATLVLRNNSIGDAGAWELAKSKHLHRLTSLDVAGNEIGVSGLSALQSMERIAELDVTSQRPPTRGRRRRALAAAT